MQQDPFQLWVMNVEERNYMMDQIVRDYNRYLHRANIRRNKNTLLDQFHASSTASASSSLSQNSGSHCHHVANYSEFKSFLDEQMKSQPSLAIRWIIRILYYYFKRLYRIDLAYTLKIYSIKILNQVWDIKYVLTSSLSPFGISPDERKISTFVSAQSILDRYPLQHDVVGWLTKKNSALLRLLDHTADQRTFDRLMFFISSHHPSHGFTRTPGSLHTISLLDVGPNTHNWVSFAHAISIFGVDFIPMETRLVFRLNPLVKHQQPNLHTVLGHYAYIACYSESEQRRIQAKKIFEEFYDSVTKSLKQQLILSSLFSL